MRALGSLLAVHCSSGSVSQEEFSQNWLLHSPLTTTYLLGLLFIPSIWSIWSSLSNECGIAESSRKGEIIGRVIALGTEKLQIEVFHP